MLAHALKEFKFLSEDDLMKLSFKELDMYYSRLDQWKLDQAAAEKKERELSRLRLVDRKRQEEKRLFKEKQALVSRKNSIKDSGVRSTKVPLRSVPRRTTSADAMKKAVDGGEQTNTCTERSKTTGTHLVFSCVEVTTTPKKLEKMTMDIRTRRIDKSDSGAAPELRVFRSQWKNDGKPLPFVKETKNGVAYPATQYAPKICYMENREKAFTAEEVAADKKWASKQNNNPVHKYTVAQDGCLYHKSASWKPSRDRCAICVKDGLHCWRRSGSNARGCLRCNYRKAKCEKPSEASSSSETEREENEVADNPSQTDKGFSGAPKRKRDQSEHNDQEEGSAKRLTKQSKVLGDMHPALEDCLVVFRSLFEDMVKESTRHHAALESMLNEAMGTIRGKDSGPLL
ncbi:hypothetical protein NP233_g8110 [Leucocoprinus birnbaumii]|uniref:Uncharacterized protein n=1 Tax=Leucocoprinus birnbaumii TaxID=56174 RepID=A0AAD5YU10_9AGAR|nr:hypothetical protein NP233_g8110 [Leucocoprinus birnbaumii]